MASFYCVYLLGFLCLALKVDNVKSQAGGGAMTTVGPYDPTTAQTTPAGAAAELEVELEELVTTTVATTKRPKPKPRRKKPPKKHRGGKRRRKQKQQKAPTPAPAPVVTTTTLRPTTPVPTTAAPATQPPSDNGRGQWGRQRQPGYDRQLTTRNQYAGQQQTGYNTLGNGGRNQNRYNGYNTGGGRSSMHVNVVATQAPTTPTPTTTQRYRYMYQPHSCPRMDVATWENEVVIYDNINCAIIIRMNPRLRRPTVTFQAPYW